MNEIDMDNVRNIMKNDYGWGDSVMNNVEEFEESKYYDNPLDDDDYAESFDRFMGMIGSDVIGEEETITKTEKKFKTDNQGDVDKLSKLIPDTDEENITFNGDGTVSIRQENKIIKVKTLKEAIKNIGKKSLSESEIMSIFVKTQNPRMSKSELIESIQNKLIISEASMDDSVRRKFESGENDYNEILGRDLTNQLAQESFRDIADNIRRKTGKENPNIMDVQQLLGQSLLSAAKKEFSMGIENLERKAVDMIRKQFNIPVDSVDIQATITGLPPELLAGRTLTQDQMDMLSNQHGVKIGKTNREGLKMTKGTSTPPQNISSEELKPKVKRRRIVNAMMHGAARKSQNLHHLDDQLRRENPELGSDYSNIMAANDANYFLLSDETIKSEGESGVHVGSVRLDLSNPQKPKIIAEGMVFPVLLHELAKGAIELMSLWSLPEDRDVRKYVLDQTDNLESETNDIRLGTKIWERFVEQIPTDNSEELIPLVWSMMQELSDYEFNSIVEGLIKNTNDSKQKIKGLVEEAMEELRLNDYEDALGDEDEDDNKYGDEDSDTLKPGEEDEEDELLKSLLKQEPEGEDDYENMDDVDLKNLIDDALDSGDMDLVRHLGSILNKRNKR